MKCSNNTVTAVLALQFITERLEMKNGPNKVDNIYEDLCWTQAVTHNPSFHYNGAGRWMWVLKYFILSTILKNLLMLLLSKLYLNGVLLRKENSSLCASSRSPNHMI